MKLVIDQYSYARYLVSLFPEQQVSRLRQTFIKQGFIKINDCVDDELKTAVQQEVKSLISHHSERRDLHLATTDHSPRYMSVVRSEFIAREGHVINTLAKCPHLLKVLSAIAGTPVIPSVSADEEFLITHQHKKGDTHDWQWGDYAFALVWVIETPPVSCGGMLQCVPYTFWNKHQPCINELLCANPINTYQLDTGDIYFLRTDTTLHRTVALNKDVTRIILNMRFSDIGAEQSTHVGNGL